jgi:carboxyl-terminal processing protease
LGTDSTHTPWVFGAAEIIDTPDMMDRLSPLGIPDPPSGSLVAALALAGAVACGPTLGGIHARMGWSEEAGLRVVDVPADGPAAGAGLERGDVVVRIDGNAVAGLSMEDTVDLLRGPVGSSAEIVVERSGVRRTLYIPRAPYR